MKKTFIRKGIFACIAAIVGIASSFAQTTITTGAVTPTSVCVGGSVTIAYTTTGTVAAGTIFSAELSNETGVFPASPNVIGTGTTSPLNGVIPAGSIAGAAYKIRVTTSTPAVVGDPSAAFTVNAIPGAPVVTSPVNYSVGDAATALPSSAGYLWYDAASGGTGSATAPTPNTASAGTKSYFVSQKVGSCEGPRSEIIVNVSCATPAPAVVTPINYNVGATPTQLPTVAGYLWYTAATGGVGSATAPTPTATTVGTTSYFVSQTLNGCEGPRAEIKVIVGACATPAPTVVTPINYNVGATPTQLPTVAGYLWYTAATGGVGSATAPTPTATTVGTTSYFVSQTLNGCEGPRAEIKVVVVCATPAPAVVTPINYNVGATPTQLPTVAGYLWYTAATGGVGSATAPTPTATTVGTTSYFVSQTQNGCEGPRAEIKVVVVCATPAPTVVTPINYNVGATPTQLPTVAGYLWYTAATGGVGSATAPTPTATTVGTTSYFVSQTQNGCEGPRAEIKVIVGACATPAPTVVTPINYNVGATPTQLPTVAGYLWYTAATGGVGSATAPTPTATTVGTTSYFVSQTLNGCEGPRAEIKVIVGACVTPAPTVVTPINYNVGATPTQLPTVAGYLWYTAATGGVGSATAPTPTATTVGTTSYFVSQTLNGCEGPRAEIKVVVVCATPAPAVVTPINYNVGATPTQLPTVAGYLWYTAATGGVGSATAPTPTATTVGTTSYFVSQTQNGCEGPRAEIKVIVGACATLAPTVVTPINYNVGATPTQLPTVAGYLWYTAATGGVGSATAPTPTATTVGTTSYFVSQTLNGCEGPRAEIKVVVVCATPAPAVVTPINYNVGATPTQLPTVAGYLWYTAATGGVGSASAPTPTATTVGTTSYFVSQTLNGCEGPRAEIKVIISACTTAAPAVTNVTYCLSETPVVLTATGTALKWYSVATGGTALTSAPIPSTATAGTTSYYVSQTLSGCEGERAKIDVIVNPQTAAPTVSNVTYCLSETPLALTATGTLLKWYSAVSGGVALASAPTPSTATAGTISYYVSQTLNGCEGTRAKIDVVVNPQTIAPTVTATVKYCFNASTTVLTASGTALKWYTTATGGTASSDAPTPSAATAGTTSYYVSQTLNGCEGLRAKIDVIVSPQTPAPTIASSALEYCQSVKAPALVATPLAGATLNWYGTSATGGTPSASAPTPSTDIEGTVTYYVGQTDANGCASARASISVKTNVTPKPALATSSVAYCQNEVAPALVATGTSLKWYLTIDDTNPRTTALVPYTAKVEDYSFYVTQTGTNTCESAKAEIKIHIKPLPSATISGNSSIPLGGTANVVINFTGDAPWSYVLSNGDSKTTSSATLSVPVSPTTTTTYVLTEVSNSCGKGIINGSALVTVQVPTLTIGVPSVSESCAGKTFTVQFQQSGSFPDGSTMKAQISTVNETSKFISVPSVINGNVITATIPDTTLKGIYYVRIANIGKDGSLIAAGNVSTGQITVNPLPVATISGTTTIYKGATANLKVDLTGNAPWTFSLNNGVTDSLVSTSINPITVKVTPKSTTTYTITAVSNQCGTGRGKGSARIQVDPVLGTEPPVVSSDWLKIYPTLVDSKCTVEITSTVSAKEADVEILDLNGHSLFKKSINQKITEVDFSQRPAGLYLLKVQNGKYSSIQRVLKP